MHAPALRSVLAALVLAATSVSAAAQALPGPRVSIDGQLMITSPSVVQDPIRANPRDPASPWTFRHLVERLAAPGDPSEWTLSWLRQWESDQALPGGVAPARPDVRRLILDPWMQASGGGRLDLSRAPFRLLAIVNRMDLRETSGTSVFSAGEGRFVFGVTRQDGSPLPPAAGPGATGLVVIFEYELPATSQAELRSWAEAWASLAGKTVGSPEYDLALERVTRRFTDQAYPGRPRGSALSQVRTNDVALARTWELREFRLDTAAFLRTHGTALTPDTVRLNGTPAFARLINDNEPSILDGSFVLPASDETAGSLSGPFTPAQFPDFALRTFVRTPLPAPGLFDAPWSAAGVRSNEARHSFALATCNGCHRGETATGFVHVGFSPVPGAPAALSGFLTGEVVPDPVQGGTLRAFSDLERRRRDLEALFLEILGRPLPRLLPDADRIPMAPH